MLFVSEPPSECENKVPTRAVSAENYFVFFPHLGVLFNDVGVDRSRILYNTREWGDLKKAILDRVHLIQYSLL